MENTGKNPSPQPSPTRGEGDRRSGEGTWSAMSLAWELGYTIAVPIVVFALAGRFADRKFGTSPWLLLAGVFLSLMVTSWLVYKKTIKIIGKQ